MRRTSPLGIATILFCSLVASSTSARQAPLDDRVPPHQVPRILPRAEAPRVVATDLSPVQQQPLGSMQLVVFYDGEPTARPSLRLHCVRGRGGEGHWVHVRDVPRSSQTGAGRISTFEVAMNGCVPTGRVIVDGVVADGVIDGVAFGLLYRDPRGAYHALRSQGAGALSIVGMWPLAMSDEAFAAQTPQLSPSVRGQAKTLLLGAEYLPNGLHSMRLPSSWSNPAIVEPIEACPHCRR